MTISAAVGRNQFIASSGQTVFTCTFPILTSTDINVYQRASDAEPNDADDLVNPADYSVSAITTSGFTLTLDTGATLNDFITIQSIVPVSRSTTFATGVSLQPANLNTEFDKEILIQQRQLGQNALVPSYPKSAYVQASDLLLPVASANDFGSGTNVVWAYDNDVQQWQLLEYNPGESVSAFRSELASHDAGEGASLVGLQGSGTVQDLADDVTGLDTDVSTLQSQVSTLNTEVGDLQTDVSGLQTDVTALQGDVSTLQTDVGILGTQVGELEGDVSTITDQLSNFGDTLSNIQNTTVISNTPSDAFPSGQALSVLVTGILRNTNTTGILDISYPLTTLDELSTSTDDMLYLSAPDTYATFKSKSFSRGLLENQDPTDWQTDLGLLIGTNVQAYSLMLSSLSSLGASTKLGDIFYGSSADTVSKLSGNTTVTQKFLSQTGDGVNSADPIWEEIAMPTGVALTKTDDTNVTLTLGGSPLTALLNATSLTLGWLGQLAVSRGGIGTNTLTSHGILLGQGTSAVSSIVALTNGQYPVGVTGSDPVAGSFSSTTTVTAAYDTTGKTWSFTATGAAANLPFNSVSSNITLVVNNRYLVISGNRTLLLPSTASSTPGDVLVIATVPDAYDPSVTATLTQSAGQIICYNNRATTTGTGGSMGLENGITIKLLYCGSGIWTTEYCATGKDFFETPNLT